MKLKKYLVSNQNEHFKLNLGFWLFFLSRALGSHWNDGSSMINNQFCIFKALTIIQVRDFVNLDQYGDRIDLKVDELKYLLGKIKWKSCSWL